MEFSIQMQDAIKKLRRRVNDFSSDSPIFSDVEMYEFISDAVDELEIEYLKKGRRVYNGDFVYIKDTSKTVKVTPAETNIYALQAAIFLTLSIKSQADRDNFSLRKPNLSVDTSHQSKDHLDTLNLLKKELHGALMRNLSSSSIGGFRVSGDERPPRVGG